MAAGDITYWSDVANAIRPPLVRLVATAVQALADNTAVALTFAAEEIDTHGFHSTVTNTSRVTPTVAGYYEVTGTVFFEAQTTPVVSSAWIRKNGTDNKPAAGRDVPGAQAFSLHTGATLISMNGTTDYVELMAQQDSAGADNTNQSIQFSSVLEVKYVSAL